MTQISWGNSRSRLQTGDGEPASHDGGGQGGLHHQHQEEPGGTPGSEGASGQDVDICDPRLEKGLQQVPGTSEICVCVCPAVHHVCPVRVPAERLEQWQQRRRRLRTIQREQWSEHAEDRQDGFAAKLGQMMLLFVSLFSVDMSGLEAEDSI